MDGIPIPMEKITELTQAAASGDVDRVAELVAEGVPVDAENEQRRTALDLAVCANQVAVVHMLLSLGAAAGGQLETVRFLLNRGARPRAEAVTHAESALARAIARPDHDYAPTPNVGKSTFK